MTQRHFTASQSSSSPHLVRRRPTLEQLESRCLLAAMTMFDEEQFVIELINRARANPAAEATRLGIDLNEGLPAGTLSASPKPPLAPHPSLIDAAAGHSQDMIDRNFFDHRNPDGDGPGERIADAGYLAARAWAENIAFHVGAAEAHDALFRSAGHRLNMLRNTYREVGIGVRERNDWGVNMTEAFAYRTGPAFLTGVAFSDQVVADSFFTAGEGLAGVTITATARTSGASYTTNTGPTGGYSLPVPGDTYDLTAAGGELTKPIAITGIGLGTANVKIDFVVPYQVPGPPIANDDRTMTAKRGCCRDRRVGERLRQCPAASRHRRDRQPAQRRPGLRRWNDRPRRVHPGRRMDGPRRIHVSVSRLRRRLVAGCPRDRGRGRSGKLPLAKPPAGSGCQRGSTGRGSRRLGLDHPSERVPGSRLGSAFGPGRLPANVLGRHGRRTIGCPRCSGHHQLHQLL
jgi:hypothetical protein